MQFSVYANSQHLAYRRMAEFVFAWLNELRKAERVYIWNPLPLEPRYFAYHPGGYLYAPDPALTPEPKHYSTYLEIRFSLPQDGSGSFCVVRQSLTCSIDSTSQETTGIIPSGSQHTKNHYPQDCATWEEATAWIQDFNIIAESDIKLIGVEKTITSYS